MPRPSSLACSTAAESAPSKAQFIGSAVVTVATFAAAMTLMYAVKATGTLRYRRRRARRPDLHEHGSSALPGVHDQRPKAWNSRDIGRTMQPHVWSGSGDECTCTHRDRQRAPNPREPLVESQTDFTCPAPHTLWRSRCFVEHQQQPACRFHRREPARRAGST